MKDKYPRPVIRWDHRQPTDDDWMLSHSYLRRICRLVAEDYLADRPIPKRIEAVRDLMLAGF